VHSGDRIRGSAHAFLVMLQGSCWSCPPPAGGAHSAALILVFGATFQIFVLLLNTTIWIYVPELFPTRMRGLGTGFILAIGIAVGAVMPLIAGRLVDGFGVAAIFAMIAIMYAIFAGCVQLLPETYGRSLPIRGADPRDRLTITKTGRGCVI